MAPRNNVLFELGLLMGGLGRERTFFVYDKMQDAKVPTDPIKRLE
jgi:predicted nucleotide-binding protein